MKKITFFQLLILFLFLQISTQGQIYSTLAGGLWSDPVTWIDGVIPGPADDVVIQGPVKTNGQSCHNLTITTTGTLSNDYYFYTQTVYGDLVNNGTVQNYVNGLQLVVFGSVENNGILDNYKLVLAGGGTHAVVTHNNHPIETTYLEVEAGGSISVSTDIYLYQTSAEFNSTQITISTGATMRVEQSTINHLNVTGSGNTSVFTGIGTQISNAPILINTSLTNLRLTGFIKFDGGCSFHGTVNNEATLGNNYNSFTVESYDQFTNNGTLQNYVNSFTINLYGNFINNGTVSNHAIDLYGSGTQTLEQQSGSVYNCQYMTCFKPSGEIVFGTDITFVSVNINMNSQTVSVPSGSVLTLQNSHLYNSTIQANGGSDAFELNSDEGSNVIDCHLYRPVLTGTVKCKNNDFYHYVVVNGTLENDYYTYTVNVHGDIENNGVITNYVKGLILNISGNLTNNGTWSNSYTYLNGASPQSITCLNGNAYTGYEFRSQNASEIFIDNSFLFQNTRVIFNDNTLRIPAGANLSMDGQFLSHCNLTGEGAASHLTGVSAIGIPWFENVAFNDLALYGNEKFGSGCSFNGTMINEGTLTNNYYSYNLTVNDLLINNGTIMTYVNGFTIDLYGNLVNNGTMTQTALDLYGSVDQTIELAAGTEFGMSYLTSYKPSGNLIALSDLTFNHVTINMDGDQFIVPTGSTVSITGGHMQNTIMKTATSKAPGEWTLTGDGTAYLLNSTFVNPLLDGFLKINSGVTFSGDVVVNGTVANDYYNYTLSVDGNITNNGSIENYVNSLSVNISGNVTNNGNWSNSYTTLNGTAPQTVTCLNDNSFSGYQFSFDNPAITMQGVNSFTGLYLQFNGNTITLEPQSLLQTGAGLLLTGGTIEGNWPTSRIHSLTSDFGSSPILENLTLSNLTMNGYFRVNGNVHFTNRITNNGGIANNYYNKDSWIEGILVNNGTITNWINGLTLYVSGNITNNGTWSNSQTRLDGTTDQWVDIMDGHAITGGFSISETTSGSGYHWFWNASPVPDPSSLFSGAYSSILNFLSYVDNTYTGAYYCLVDGIPGRNIYINMTTALRLDLTLFLEGPFNSSTGMMENNLAQSGYIPGDQPFRPALPYYQNTNPVWYYTGSESAGSIPANVVDWVLVELRDAATAGQATSDKIIGQQACFVTTTGEVVATDGVSKPSFQVTPAQNLYVVVYHRNHLAVMSNYPVTESGGFWSYDFSTSADKVYGGSNGHKELIPGVWGMVSGDGDGNGLIQNTDETNVWKTDLGSSGYSAGDFDLNGLTQNSDETSNWKPNLGGGGQVPTKAGNTGYSSQVPK